MRLRSLELVRGARCGGGFWAIEPRGYVCNDRTVTRAPSRLDVDAWEAAASGPGPFPYRYAISDGAPMYERIPTAREQTRKERPYGKRGVRPELPRWARSHWDLAEETPLAASDPIPWFLTPEAGRPAPLSLVRGELPFGSMVSFRRAFEAEGRVFLLSAEGALVPADRVRVFRPSAFHGTRLGGDVALPLAWIRRAPRAKHALAADGSIRPTQDAWPAQSFVALTGEERRVDGVDYLVTRERGADGEVRLIAAGDATVARAEDKLPLGVKTGQKWILVRISDGTLVAYEGLTPVYSTLVSPGRGGVPRKGVDNVEAATTPTGTYSVTFKDRAATMSPDQGPDRKFWIADVPHTQYFDPPFALHAAYWHERFGEPTSAGCINLSPIDAKAMFDWSDPPVPEGWQGATGAGAVAFNGPTTMVVVRR